MESIELEGIKMYWGKKYPTVIVNLWNNEHENKYFGKMMTHNGSIDLVADTIGELISQGEAFLRKVVN